MVCAPHRLEHLRGVWATEEFENHSDGYLSGYIIPLWSLGHIDKQPRNRNFPSGSNSKRG